VQCGVERGARQGFGPERCQDLLVGVGGDVERALDAFQAGGWPSSPMTPTWTRGLLRVQVAENSIASRNDALFAGEGAEGLGQVGGKSAQQQFDGRGMVVGGTKTEGIAYGEGVVAGMNRNGP